MDILSHLENISWCKPDWSFLSLGKETKGLLRQCAPLPILELSDDVEDIIKKSNAFPAEFPIQSVRLEMLKERRPIEKLKRNIISTYPIIHERVLLLMTHFLIYKRAFGSSIEKAFYKDMSVPDLIDRILKKRALMFVGPHDCYKLLSGESAVPYKAANLGAWISGKFAIMMRDMAKKSGTQLSNVDQWESVGTPAQKAPLLLENCLSYDEMKLSSMVYVSGHTECINDGSRNNGGVVTEDGVQEDAVIIGIVGPRFQRVNRMEYEDIIITEQQNCLENGYGEEKPTLCLDFIKSMGSNSSKRMWRQMWSEFYQVHNYTYKELSSDVNIQDESKEQKYMDRYVKLNHYIFDNEVYYKRLSVTAECTLLEADARGEETGRDAFVNVIGAGLGVWKVSSHQADVYVITFLERIRALLSKDLLNHVSDVNFSYIEASESVSELFTSKSKHGEHKTEKHIFFESKTHPKGGISVTLQKREPSSRLTGEHEGKLLVITYPWDGNAHPGNEFWLGSLTTSGDSAAACSTQVSELHNAHINNAVSANNTRVVSRHGLHTLAEYAAMKLSQLDGPTSD